MKNSLFSLLGVSSFVVFLMTTISVVSSQEAPPVAAPSANVAPIAPSNVATPVSAPPVVAPTSTPQCCGGMAAQAPSVAASSETPTCRNYSSVHVDGPYIAITFDDGPSATLTPRLLDMLKQRGIKATFFVIGENAAAHPEIVAREVAEGHEVGNHTWSHPALTKISEARVQEELNKTSDAIFQATGKKPVLMRPPYGAMNPRLTRMIEQQDGMKVILWSVDPNDWKRPGSAIVSQRLLAGTKPGAITLSHDIHPGTIDAMPATLDAWIAKGYKFVTVSELIAMESKTPLPAATPSASVAPKKKHKSSSKKNS